jgi:hypothetical protein
MMVARSMGCAIGAAAAADPGAVERPNQSDATTSVASSATANTTRRTRCRRGPKPTACVCQPLGVMVRDPDNDSSAKATSRAV